MFKGLSRELKQIMIDELCKKYDSINMKLQNDLAKLWYDEWQLEDMKSKLKRIDEIITELKKED